MLCLRVDDFPGTKPEEFWRHNLDNFKRFNAVLEKHQLGYTIGVIPRYTNDDQLRYLAGLQHVEVALHGINHDERFPNEFRDHQTENDVYQAIRSAVAPLDEICGPVKKYIPPHNVIDRKTVNALHRAGFECVMGGPGSDMEVLKYCYSRNMGHVYSTEPLEYGRSDELLQRGSVEHLRNEVNRRFPVWLTLHWTWEWNIGLENLDKYLVELKDVITRNRD
mgnify:CR=1 FL=1